MNETQAAAWSSGHIDEPHVYFDRILPARLTGKPPVVMIHGGAHTGACYLETASGRPGWAHRFVAAGYPVVVPDWPGTGRSGYVPPDQLTGTLVCNGLARLVAGLGEPAIVVTHSMSGAFGWKLLERCGPAIMRLVAVALGPPGNIQPVAHVAEETAEHVTVHGTTNYVLSRHAPFVATAAFARSKLIGSSRHFPAERADRYAAMLQPIAARLLHERLNLAGSQVRVDDPGCLAGKPVLMLTGTEDVDHPRAVDAALAEWLRVQGAEVDHIYLGDIGLHGNGHMMMLEENSDVIADLIIARLREAPMSLTGAARQ